MLLADRFCSSILTDWAPRRPTKRLTFPLIPCLTMLASLRRLPVAISLPRAWIKRLTWKGCSLRPSRLFKGDKLRSLTAKLPWVAESHGYLDITCKYFEGSFVRWDSSLRHWQWFVVDV